MHVLIIKTSSLGDVVHTLPAVTDASRAVPGLVFDWVVEESLAEIPAWHPAVQRVIPVALRRWRKGIGRAWYSGEWGKFKKELRRYEYNRVIDAQGLIKSALITRKARGRRCGLAMSAAREPLAALAYERRYPIRTGQHAIERVRQLFAACLGYTVPTSEADYGIDTSAFARYAKPDDYLVFLHGTTWPTKHWPESYWVDLARLAGAQGLTVYLPWGSHTEKDRAERIAAVGPHVQVLERMDLTAMAGVLAGARGVVAVDTGLSHLAAALGTPCVSLYGATKPGLTGTVGEGQRHLKAQFPCAPCLGRTCIFKGPAEVQPACYAMLPPALVWETLSGVLV